MPIRNTLRNPPPVMPGSGRFGIGALGIVACGLLHLLALGVDAAAYVPGWINGIFWTLEHWLPVAQQAPPLVLSGFAFWSTLASAAVPMILLGLHWYTLERRGLPISRFGPVALLAWACLMCALMPPSGFILIAIAAGACVFSTPRGGWTRAAGNRA